MAKVGPKTRSAVTQFSLTGSGLTENPRPPGSGQQAGAGPSLAIPIAASQPSPGIAAVLRSTCSAASVTPMSLGEDRKGPIGRGGGAAADPSGQGRWSPRPEIVSGRNWMVTVLARPGHGTGCSRSSAYAAFASASRKLRVPFISTLQAIPKSLA